MLRDLLFLIVTSLLLQCPLQVESVGFLDPQASGGSMLTYTLNTTPANLGEPLNIIISYQSDPRVLAETMFQGGLYNYLEAAGFGGECMGLHMGDAQQTNLWDGEKNQTQRVILRYQYFKDHFLGTCLESIFGGTHIRVFKQSTSGAYFINTSAEEDSTTNHDLGSDSYDQGRNLFIGNVTGIEITGTLSSQSQFTGQIEKRGYVYETTVSFVDGLIPTNRTLWNHYTGVQVICEDVSDGLVAVFTVQVTSTP